MSKKLKAYEFHLSVQYGNGVKLVAAKARAYEHNSKLRRPQGLEKPPRLDLHRGRKGKLR